MTSLQFLLTLLFGISTYVAYLYGIGKGYRQGYNQGYNDLRLLYQLEKSGILELIYDDKNNLKDVKVNPAKDD